MCNFDHQEEASCAQCEFIDEMMEKNFSNSTH